MSNAVLQGVLVACIALLVAAIMVPTTTNLLNDGGINSGYYAQSLTLIGLIVLAGVIAVVIYILRRVA